MNTEEYENVLSIHRVPVSKLRSEFNPEQFHFETTNDLKQLPKEMIGQQRAEQAMKFGLSVEQSGYNLFVVGPSGTGRMTYTQDSVSKMAKNRPVPDDWCYVYNFENPDRPLVISLPAGHGQQFQRKIELLLVEIEREIRSTFTSEAFEKNKRTILEEFREKVEARWKEADDFAMTQNYKIERTSNGINTFPLRFGRPLAMKEYDKLSDQDKELIRDKEKQVEEKIQETVYQIRKMDEELRKSVDQFMKQTAAYAIEGLFQPLKERYRDNQKVSIYLEAYFHDAVEHFSLFLADHEEQKNIMNALTESKEQQLHRYTVNLFVSQRNLNGAPVIYETNPTYQNLFGKVEYKGAFGSWVTDFTYIKPGALQLANGGYLILQATELLQQPYAWSLLKRALQTGQVQIENLYEDKGAFPTSGHKPEPIALNIKVIIIGSYHLYDLLSSADEDFHKLFKVKVEFDTVMEKSEENSLKMAHFVKNYAEHEGLLPFHRNAVAKIIDYSSRLDRRTNKDFYSFSRNYESSCRIELLGKKRKCFCCG